MGRRERDGPGSAAELDALLDVGDHHAAAVRARGMLAHAATPERERVRARAALKRTGRDPVATVVALLGLVCFALVAAFGLLVRS